MLPRVVNCSYSRGPANGVSPRNLGLDDDLQGNVQHIAEHGITKAEVVKVLGQPEAVEQSHSSGRSVAIGTADAGRAILVVYEQINEDTVYPVTAYELDE